MWCPGISSWNTVARAKNMLFPRRLSIFSAIVMLFAGEQHDDGGEDGEPAGEQHVFRAGHGVPRTDSGAPHAGLHDAALPRLSQSVRHVVLDGGHGVLLGDAVVGSGVHAHAGAARGGLILADASLRADYFLAEFPLEQDDGEGVRGVPDRAGRARAGERGRRGAAIVQRELRADLSVRVHAGGVAVLRAAQGTGGFGEDDESRVPRRAVPRGEYAGGDGAAGGERSEGHAGLSDELEVLRVHGVGRAAAASGVRINPSQCHSSVWLVTYGERRPYNKV